MNLTDDELRIKVAESFGWRCEKVPNEDGHGVRFGHTMRWRSREDTRIAHFLTTEPPNYPQDLNACAEFEATLTDEEWNVYSAQIVSLTLWDRATDTVKRVLQATARQRCLAYLKVKGIIQ